MPKKLIRCCLNIVDPMEINVVEMHDLINKRYDLLEKDTQASNLDTQRGKRRFYMLDHKIRTRHDGGGGSILN